MDGSWRRSRNRLGGTQAGLDGPSDRGRRNIDRPARPCCLVSVEVEPPLSHFQLVRGYCSPTPRQPGKKLLDANDFA